MARRPIDIILEALKAAPEVETTMQLVDLSTQQPRDAAMVSMKDGRDFRVLVQELGESLQRQINAMERGESEEAKD